MPLDVFKWLKMDNVEDREKSDKVVKEIILGFLAKNTLSEVFKGFGIPTRSGLKIFFEKVAHCSIMRLNENSMDKLYDLMMMQYKYHLIKMTMPEQIMTVTVNHLRALLDLVPLDREIGAAVEHAYTMAYTYYRPLGPMGWYMLRNTLLVFFQDTRVKVSSLVRASMQQSNGKFVIFDKNTPIQLMENGQPVGEIKYFTKTGDVSHTSDFPTPYKYVPFENFPDTLDAPKRSTDLGFNNYKSGDGLQIFGGGIGKLPKGVKEGNEMAFLETLMSTTTTSNVDGQLGGMAREG
uniref:Uncharacterized protein n=1 Tax=Caenorhabditis japonica TaxID=281687 RepID=A0A8R1DNC9_CAEJA